MDLDEIQSKALNKLNEKADFFNEMNKLTSELEELKCYEDYTPERIDRFYTEKEQLPENQEFVRINNKETLAQIFTDIRYTRKDNEAMSSGLLEALKIQGFLD